MGPRLELKYGLVAEADRLSTSADAMLVTEPATGSKVRSKGNLYLVVSSARNEVTSDWSLVRSSCVIRTPLGVVAGWLPTRVFRSDSSNSK